MMLSGAALLFARHLCCLPLLHKVISCTLVPGLRYGNVMVHMACMALLLDDLIILVDTHHASVTTMRITLLCARHFSGGTCLPSPTSGLGIRNSSHVTLHFAQSTVHPLIGTPMYM